MTNVAPVHLEFFSSIADIARAKYELIQELHSGAVAVLNADDEFVSQFGRDFHGKVVHYGIHHQANVSGQKIESLGAGAHASSWSPTACARRSRCRCWESTTSITRLRRPQ